MGSLIYFTTNEGEYDDLEGLIISEQLPPGFISGADVNGVGICGVTLKGPVDTPLLIGSEAEFLAIFGHRSRFGTTTLVNQVWLSMINKQFGPRLTITRVAASDAATAERDFLATATPIINIAASSPGAWGADLTAAIEDATDGNANHFNLVVGYRGNTVTYKNLDVTAGMDNLLSTIGNGNDVLVTVTKLADGRPDNIAATALTDTVGSDGTLADTDYTAANRGIETLSSYPGVSAIMVAERATAAVKAKLHTDALAAVDRMYLLWNGSHTADRATVVTDAATYRSDRVIYCWNSPTLFDFEVAALVEVAPHHHMLSLLSQLEPNQSVASKRTQKYLASIKSLHFNPSRADLIALKEAGVCALEQLRSGYKFRSAVTTSLTAGLEFITRRRTADYLQLSAAERLQDFVEEEDTTDISNTIISELAAFCDELKDEQRMIEDFEILGEATNVLGVKVIKWRVKLIKHIHYLVLETEIGTGVTLEVAEAA